MTVSVSGIAAVGALAYLVGGIPVGWLVVRQRRLGLDLRDFGSGNIGTSNAYRHAGGSIAAVVGPLQFLQGFLPVALTDLLGLPTAVRALAAVCAVIGNGWPVYLGFNGGRGVAVATGAVAALSWPGLLVLLACYAVGQLAREIALGVLVGFLLLPVACLLGGGWQLFASADALLLLIVVRRLEGVVADLRRHPCRWRILRDRVLFDRRPGRPVEGPIRTLAGDARAGLWRHGSRLRRP